MQYSFRLAELIGHSPDPRKRPGTIKAIVEKTGLDRHQVAALLKNEMKYIPLKALSKLCDYLVEHGHAKPGELPGKLFAVEAENFWEMLASRKRLQLCLGVRQDDGAWVAASDSVMLGEILNGVSTLGGTAPLRQKNSESGESAPPPPHPESLKQSLVRSPGQGTPEQVRLGAEEVYNEFSEAVNDRALISLGSVKSNPVVELMIAAAFGCDPFVSQDGVATPQDRKVPFFLRYRSYDPHPESCCGGLALSASEETPDPGIYYETANGSWKRVPWTEKGKDTALVFYTHREAQGRLEMAVGGYSGDATRMLGKVLATQGEDFWPPVFTGQGVQIGAFIAKFDFKGRKPDILGNDISANSEIIPLPSAAFERRMPA